MTPKRDEFEEKLEAAAIRYSDSIEHWGVFTESYKSGGRWGHKEGKQEGRAEMLSEVLQALRQAREVDGTYIGAAKAKDMRTTADWLEKRFKGEK